MSTIELTNRWMETAGDRLNPILVKEARQALKSRQFVITFMLLLFVSWVMSAFMLLLGSDAVKYGAVGPDFFFLYYIVLAVAIFVIVPFGAYRSLLSEKDENTYDLLSITTLKPRQIVWGKLLNAFVQLLIYYSAIAPFIAFTSLLEGFDLAQVSFLLVVSMLVSLEASMVALMLATMARQKQWQALNSLGLLGGLVALLFSFFGIAGGVLSTPLPVDQPEFWWGMSFTLLAGITYFILFQQITTAQLTFEAGNRSTGIRITGSVQFLLLWASILFYSWITGGTVDAEAIFLIVSLSAVHLAALGLFVSTEDDQLSHRVVRALPENSTLRLLLVPFLPGGGRGLLYLLLHLGLTILLAIAATLIWAGAGGLFGATGRWDRLLSFTLAVCSYIAFYIGLGTLCGRWMRMVSAEIKPAHIRVVTLLILALGTIFPLIPQLFGLVRSSGYSLLYITVPFWSLMELERDRGYSGVIVLFTLVGAGVVIALNLMAVRRGITEVLTAQFIPRTRREVEQSLHLRPAGEPAS